MLLTKMSREHRLMHQFLEARRAERKQEAELDKEKRGGTPGAAEVVGE